MTFQETWPLWSAAGQLMTTGSGKTGAEPKAAMAPTCTSRTSLLDKEVQVLHHLPQVILPTVMPAALSVMMSATVAAIADGHGQVTTQLNGLQRMPIADVQLGETEPFKLFLLY